MMDFGVDHSESKSDLLGNKIGHCIFYLEMPDDLFSQTMREPASGHAREMAEITDNGTGGKEAVRQHLGRLTIAYAHACLAETPYAIQERVEKKLSTIFSVDKSLAQNIWNELQTPPNFC